MAFHEDYIDKKVPFVVGSPNVGDTSVGSEDNNRGCFTLEGSVQEREAFHVEHMYFVNKKNSWDYFSLALFSPF